jgi:hypothetical protein
LKNGSGNVKQILTYKPNGVKGFEGSNKKSERPLPTILNSPVKIISFSMGCQTYFT